MTNKEVEQEIAADFKADSDGDVFYSSSDLNEEERAALDREIDRDLKANGLIKIPVAEGFNKTSEKVVALATELARSGDPDLTLAAETAVGAAEVAHTVVKAGVVAAKVGCVISKWAGVDPEWSDIALEKLNEAHQKVESYKPENIINNALSDNINWIHDMVLDLLNEDNLNSLLVGTGDLLENQVKPQQPPKQGAEETKQLLKEEAKVALAAKLEEVFAAKNSGYVAGYVAAKQEKLFQKQPRKR